MSRRAGVTNSAFLAVVVALAGVGPFVDDHQPADRTSAGAAYLEVLSTYGDHPAAAVRLLVQWSRGEIDRGLVQLPRTAVGMTLRSGGGPATRLLEQMALLHAETAFAQYRRNDGSQMGVHLEWSRRIVGHDLPWPPIDVLPTTPIDRAFRTEWALLVTGFFHFELAVTEARRFLDDELQAAPRDPMLLLARGITEEIAASERAQPRGGSAVAKGLRLARMSAERRSALEAAASLYRRALAEDAALHEARLRLARSLFILSDGTEMERELEHVLAHSRVNHEQYLGNLFLAAVYERRRQIDAAARHFSRAAEIFPAAQAPYLALSRLKSSSDPSAAGEILLEMFGRSNAPNAAGVADPWWLYDAGFGASMPARLDRLRAEARAR